MTERDDELEKIKETGALLLRAFDEEVATLRARVAELEAGLKPFADEADKAERQYADAFGDIAPVTLAANVTIGQCRVARSTLSKEPKP